MNRGEEDYIKAIYELKIFDEEIEYITNQQLVDFFNHSAQTVSEMVKKLNKHKLIIYTPYKGSILTEKGENAAIRLIRVHRIWELFLVKHLNYTWEEVHEEAEKLEHVTSNLLEKRMYSFLGKPKKGPLGNPIPNEDGKFENSLNIKLLDAKKEKIYKIVKVSDSIDLLKYLNHLNLQIGSTIKIISIDSFGEILELEYKETKIFIAKKIANMIFVSEDLEVSI